MLFPQNLLWLVLFGIPLLVLQRGLHREVQAVLLLLTRRREISIALFSLVFLPGVLLHETSHFLMARMLGVRTGRFSIVPQAMPDGRLQLGYVETSVTDWLRDSLIGMAPLILGGAFVAYAGLVHLGLDDVWEAARTQGLPAAVNLLPGTYSRPDFWLWFYLTFAVSSTMLPSASDRRAWLPLGLTVGLLGGVSLMAGAGPWMAENLAGPLALLVQALLAVLGISLVAHVFLLLPLYGLRRLLSWMTGLEVR